VITFFPEFELFELEEFTPDVIALLKKKVYDVSGFLKRVSVSKKKSLQVYLNGKLLPS